MPTFGIPTPINDLSEIPSSLPAAVYIVGHAVPNGLRNLKGQLVDEGTVARQLVSRDANTLVIFDICFAEAFEQIPNFNWPDRIGRIYSCLKHERTWHNGDELAPARQSLFSRELNKAMAPCIAVDSFDSLQSSLITSFGDLQTPLVTVKPPLRPSTFF